MKTIVSVCSARPNFVKLAAVHHALTSHADIRHVIVHTGQHYDPLFSDIFFEQLDIPLPVHNLGIHGGTRDEVINQTQSAFAAIIGDIRPDIVLVYGDVNGAVGAARAAKEYGCAIGHVEAGLRSFDESMPEEHNRIAVDWIANLLFCSEPSGMENLENEGIHGERFLVGNTMIDTLVRMKSAIANADLPKNLPKEYGVVTLHRPSNVDDKAMLTLNVETLVAIAKDTPLILPVHHRLKSSLEQFMLWDTLSKSVELIPALGYLPFLKLISGARFILTDSGGIQEEATYLQKRCYTLRKNTERPITLESGSNILVDLENDHERTMLIEATKSRESTAINVPALWDGKAGERIVSVLQSFLA